MTDEIEGGKTVARLKTANAALDDATQELAALVVEQAIESARGD